MAHLLTSIRVIPKPFVPILLFFMKKCPKAPFLKIISRGIKNELFLGFQHVFNHSLPYIKKIFRIFWAWLPCKFNFPKLTISAISFPKRKWPTFPGLKLVTRGAEQATQHFFWVKYEVFYHSIAPFFFLTSYPSPGSIYKKMQKKAPKGAGVTPGKG